MKHAARQGIWSPWWNTEGLPCVQVRMTARTSAATVAQVANLYDKGLTSAAIAAKVGVSRTTVNKVVKDLAAEGAVQSRAQRRANDDDVAALRAEGLSAYEIADKLGFSQSHIHKIIRRLEADGAVARIDGRAERHARARLASPDTPPIVRTLLSNRQPGEPLSALTVMSGHNDPFRVDTPEKMAAGRWLANEIARLDADPAVRREEWWNRGLHYALLGRTKPDGTTYVNDADTWDWLDSVASKSARWSGLLPFDRIIDRKNNKPTIRLAEDIDPTARTGHYLDDIELMPVAWLTDFGVAQPYRIALVAEKSSAGDLLEPLSNRYSTDLYLPDGEMTDTMIHRMAQAAADDGRPLVVLYFSDCDPSGYQMPISLSRKLQAFKAIEFPALEFRVVQAAMLPDQVSDYGLPSTPLKETEQRAGAWMDAWGVEQTELDSLTSLRPDLFEAIAVEAIERFYDTDLDAEVARLRDRWEDEAREAVAELARDGEQARLRREAETALDALRQRIEADLAAAELPEVPDVPESDLDPGDVPNTVIDSADDWRTQTRKLIERKRYS